ncbi:hypothetical protein MRX96_043057 [Rhipicephalus microplus]
MNERAKGANDDSDIAGTVAKLRWVCRKKRKTNEEEASKLRTKTKRRNEEGDEDGCPSAAPASECTIGSVLNDPEREDLADAADAASLWVMRGQSER